MPALRAAARIPSRHSSQGRSGAESTICCQDIGLFIFSTSRQVTRSQWPLARAVSTAMTRSARSSPEAPKESVRPASAIILATCAT